MIVDLKRQWLPWAKCKGMNVEGFFAPHAANLKNPGRKLREAWDEAKTICDQCPVKWECARDHLGETEGIWGGLDPIQRKELRFKHSQRVRRLTGDLKDEYAQLAHYLQARGYNSMDSARIIGVGRHTVDHLRDWYQEHLRAQDEAPPEPSGLTVEKVRRQRGATRNRKSRTPAG